MTLVFEFSKFWDQLIIGSPSARTLSFPNLSLFSHTELTENVKLGWVGPRSLGRGGDAAVSVRDEVSKARWELFGKGWATSESSQGTVACCCPFKARLSPV